MLNTLTKLVSYNCKRCLHPQNAQSPINILRKDAITMDYPPIKIDNLSSEKKFKIINTGHTYELESLSKSAILTGGPLRKKYKFDRLQFHWGKKNTEGSEHQIDGEKYSLEAHFHWTHSIKYDVSMDVLKESKARFFKKLCAKNTIEGDKERLNFITKELGELYDWPLVLRKDGKIENETIVRCQQLTTLKAIDEYLQWMQNNDKLSNPCENIAEEKRFATITNKCLHQPITVSATLAVFFKVDDCAPRYDALTTVKEVASPKRYFIFNKDVLSQLIPILNLNQYYAYTGSTTLPPYPTNVTWIVLTHPLLISPEQLESLRLLAGAGGTFMNENCREVQDMGGRCLYSYDKKVENEERKDKEKEGKKDKGKGK